MALDGVSSGNHYSDADIERLRGQENVPMNELRNEWHKEDERRNILGVALFVGAIAAWRIVVGCVTGSVTHVALGVAFAVTGAALCIARNQRRKALMTALHEPEPVAIGYREAPPLKEIQTANWRIPVSLVSLLLTAVWYADALRFSPTLLCAVAVVVAIGAVGRFLKRRQQRKLEAA